MFSLKLSSVTKNNVHVHKQIVKETQFKYITLQLDLLKIQSYVIISIF